VNSEKRAGADGPTELSLMIDSLCRFEVSMLWERAIERRVRIQEGLNNDRAGS
jgi:hypothetical protein